ncbi:ABC transporter substrate-binding protein [Rhizobacter sp. AJA081-3]|uniref:ABC transporter substrate-binding protein n=1 Tax=Rhizobacter sp. AJA081-3 TaxID=2753607 RepID=UPI001FD7E308|nr:ABC transporter substrate-binding protein [Rhizobacter sp. AJA081-3]
MHHIRLSITCLALATGALSALPALAGPPTVEVLHFMTSGGQAKGMKSLKDDLEAQGGKWVDTPVGGGNSEDALAKLRTRVMGGDAPSSVQLKGPLIQEWGALGVLQPIDDVATAGRWEQALPKLVSDTMKYKGQWVAAPVNIHRLDWMYANPAVLSKVGIRMPATWEEFDAAADKLKAAGITPLAHGGQAWQDASLFEIVVASVGGPAFHRKALVELDNAALTGPTMKQVFDRMRKLRGYVDANFSGRDWNVATNMIINGQAGFQLMGDWVKGDMSAAGKLPGRDYVCANPPGHGGGSFLFIVDSFAMFKSKNPDVLAGQKLFGKLMMEPRFQENFNLAKGSIPVRNDMKLDKFDACALAARDQMDKSIKGGGFNPSAIHDMAVASAVRGAMTDVATKHFNSSISSDEAVQLLARSIKQARE